MDNLFEKGIITDPVTYLEAIPDKYIPNKQKIIDDIKAQQEAQQQALMAQQMAQIQAQAPGNPPSPDVTEGMQDGVDNRAPSPDVNNQQLQQTYAKSKEFYGGGTGGTAQ